MSFRCDHCTLANPRIVPATATKPMAVTDSLPRRVVVARRAHAHPQRRAYRWGIETVIDRGGKGSQIAREMNLCSPCDEYRTATGSLPPVDLAPVRIAAVQVTDEEKARSAVNAFAALKAS